MGVGMAERRMVMGGHMQNIPWEVRFELNRNIGRPQYPYSLLRIQIATTEECLPTSSRLAEGGIAWTKLWETS